LLDAVLGATPGNISLATLPDHAVHWVADQPFPMILPSVGATAEGILLTSPDAEQIARLNFYEGGFAYDLRSVTVHTETGEMQAQVYFPQDGLWQPGAPFSLDDWIAQWGQISVDTAGFIMTQFGKISTDDAQKLLPFMRARAWARQLAAEPAPRALRYDPGPEDVQLLPDDRSGFDGFFQLRVFTLQHSQFAGGMSPPIRREAFVAYDAALVLPYDPVQDSVLLIEQIRYGPICRGDPAAWVLEPIAGLVDAGEDPEDAARREAIEEAGLEMGDLLPIAKVYPSPGYSSEFFHCYLGLCDLDGRGAHLGGLDSESEDIRSHVLPFAQAMDLVESGEINAAPLVMMLLWLSGKRDDLRAALR
jgi:ADP-ribose pyrophosphatase